MTTHVLPPAANDGAPIRPANVSAEEEAELREAAERARQKHEGKLKAPPAPAPLSGLLSKVVASRPVLRTWPCAGCGVVVEAVRNPGLCEDCDEKRQRVLFAERRDRIRARVLTPLDEDFQHVSFGHPALGKWVHSKRALSVARSNASLEYDDTCDPKRWSQMLLLGPTGSGKTTLAAAVFRHQLESALKVAAVHDAPLFEATRRHRAARDRGERDRLGEEIEDLKATIKAAEEAASRLLWVQAVDLARARSETRIGQEVDRLKQARDVTVLVVDDLGQGQNVSYDDVVAVLSDRQKARKKTIVTYGFPLAQLAEFGEHFERRFTERTHVVELRKASPARAAAAGGGEGGGA